MPDASILNPHPPEFERFLYASVGEDRNGSVVTVLSALARLGLDPWNETAELVALGREAAGARIGTLLSRLLDVPSLGRDHRMVAQELSLLLPEPPRQGGLASPDMTAIGGRLVSSGALWKILAIMFILMQLLFVIAPGSGE